jgi:hypothetical protein
MSSKHEGRAPAPAAVAVTAPPWSVQDITIIIIIINPCKPAGHHHVLSSTRHCAADTALAATMYVMHVHQAAELGLLNPSTCAEYTVTLYFRWPRFGCTTVRSCRDLLRQ